jgi:two-component system chemotaxis response regulator CheB
VLVIDDSAFVRRTLRTLLLSSRDIEVVGTAADGNEGLQAVEKHDPDVITLDLEMPRLDGFAFLRILMRRRPTPVIVVSSHTERQTVLRALELGALDFVAKPAKSASPNLKQIRGELVDKVLAGAGSLVEQLRRRIDGSREIATVDAAAAEPSPRPRPVAAAEGLVVVGTSTGGPTTLRRILGQLPDELPYGIVVAQHMPARFTRAFAERLDREFPQSVREAEHGALIRAGEVIIAPGGCHTEVQPRAKGFETTVMPAKPGERYIPSVDRLFSSAADAAGSRVVALVLTGMGSDGAMGVQYVKIHGGRTLAEDESTAVVFGMPRVAIATGAVETVLPLEAIAPRLLGLVSRR